MYYEEKEGVPTEKVGEEVQKAVDNGALEVKVSPDNAPAPTWRILAMKKGFPP
jgi:hypothetical protein